MRKLIGLVELPEVSMAVKTPVKFSQYPGFLSRVFTFEDNNKTGKERITDYK